MSLHSHPPHYLARMTGPADDAASEQPTAPDDVDRARMSCAVALVARCMSCIGFGTSLISIGLFFLVPSFSSPAPELQTKRPRRRSLPAPAPAVSMPPSTPVQTPPRRRVTLPSYESTRSSSLTRSPTSTRHVTFQDLPLPPTIPEHVDTPEMILPEDCSSSTSTTFSSNAGCQSHPSSPQHVSIFLPDDHCSSEPEPPMTQSTRQRRRPLSMKLPKVPRMFLKNRRRVSDDNVVEDDSLLLKSIDDLAKSSRRTKPFRPLLSFGHGRRESEPNHSFSSKSSKSPDTSPSLSPSFATQPLPSTPISTESHELPSPRSRKSNKRRSAPQGRTEPYGAPYFATPPTLVSSTPIREVLPQRPERPRRPSTADGFESDAGQASPTQRLARSQTRKVVVKRRSASADCILRNIGRAM